MSKKPPSISPLVARMVWGEVADAVVNYLREPSVQRLIRKEQRASLVSSIAGARLVITDGAKPEARHEGGKLEVSEGGLMEVIARALRDLKTEEHRPVYRERLLALFYAHALVRSCGVPSKKAIGEAGKLVHHVPGLGAPVGWPSAVRTLERRALKAMVAGRRLKRSAAILPKGAEDRPRPYRCEHCAHRFETKDMFTSSGLCGSCYAQNWDDAFSSQASYSDGM